MNESLWQSANWVDLVLALALAAAFLVGLGMGFYRQLAIVIALGLGIVLAGQFSTRLATSGTFEAVHARFGATGAECAAFCTIVLAPLLLALLSILVFRSFFGRTLKVLDSLLGGLLGLAIGVLAFGLVLLATFHWEDTWLHEPVRASVLGSRLAEVARASSQVFPEEYRRRVEASLQERISTLAGSATHEDRAPEKPGAEPK
ncbi:MAG: CvpA family protein [Planctomycetota bacterium]